MSSIRQLGVGLLAAILSAAILLGSFGLAFSESSLAVSILGATPTLFSTSTSRPTSTLRPSSTPLPPTATSTPTVTPTPTVPTATTTPTQTCLPPPGWVGIIVQPGQTLESIAQDYNITPEALAQGNCLTDEVIPGMLLFVPPLQPTTRPTEPCGRPPGWVSYVVQSGDTLYSLAVELNVTVYQLQVANCMIGQTTIHTGQALWVPRLPVRTTPTLTEEPTDTEVPPTETSEPTDTPEPTATNPNNPPDSP